jgi:hypothetical protein
MSFDSPLPPYNASDPTATFLNSSCLDLLMIELVPMAYRIVNEIDAPTSPPPSTSNPANASSPIQSRKEGSLKSGTGTAGVGNGIGGRKMDEDEERDAVFYRLEMLGYRVGQGLVERYSSFSTFPLFQFIIPKPFWLQSLEGGISNVWMLIEAKIQQRPSPLHRHAGRHKIPM